MNWRAIFGATTSFAMVLLANPLLVQAEGADPFAKQKAIFHNVNVLKGAVEKIGQMQEPELRAFARYLAECNDQGISDVSKHACDAALKSYQIEFGSDGANTPLEALIFARATLDGRPPQEMARDMPNLNDPDAAKKSVDAIFVDVKIISAIENAVRARFYSLRQVAR